MSLLHSLMAMFHILTTRKGRRFLLVFLVLSVGCILMIMLSPSQGSLSLGGYYGLDSTWRPISAQNNRWRGHTVARPIELPEATWTCTDDGLPEQDKETKSNRRSRQCVVENLCVDRKGAFIRSNGLWSRKNLPKVNLMSSDEEADDFWQPRLERSWRKVIHAHFVNETIFVHSLYPPFHFSHWLYNGMIPLYSTMKRFGGTKDSWTFRGGRFKKDSIDRQGAWEINHFFDTGKELVLSQAELSTPFQSLPPADAPICFRRAIIGLGSQCALNYCENNIPAEIYKSFREDIAQYYWSSPETWERHLAKARETIGKGSNRQEQGHKKRQTAEAKEQGPGQQQKQQEQELELKKKRQDLSGDNIPNSQLRCLELARYYNFEAAGPNHGLEQGELQSRVGRTSPDVVDSEKDYHNLFVEAGTATEENKGEANEGSKRKLVVGIIQREKSRRLINDEDLIQGLVQAGFRVKWMTLDHGCGLAETAYLLRDVNVLISPHGSAIGASIFMPNHGPVSTVISVDNSRHWEDWFRYTATAIGQRFMQTVCGPSNYVDESLREQCPFHRDLTSGLDLIGYTNLVLGLPDSMVKTDEEKKSMSSRALSSLRATYRKYVKNHPEAQKLAEQEMEVLIGAEQPNALIRKYGEDTWTFLSHFWKGAPRYVDVGSVVKFVQSLQRDLEHEKIVESSTQQNHSVSIVQQPYALYLEYVRKGQACGSEECEEVLRRNVADEKTTAYGRHSIDDVSKWGQPTSESQALRSGLTTEVLGKGWQMDAQK